MVICVHKMENGDRSSQFLKNPNQIISDGQVGGLQLKEAKPLEGKLKEFMDSATEGAVLVSFGSALKPEQMPPEKIQVFIDTFKNLGMKVIIWYHL